jgi:hypothetical protein
MGGLINRNASTQKNVSPKNQKHPFKSNVPIIFSPLAGLDLLALIFLTSPKIKNAF